MTKNFTDYNLPDERGHFEKFGGKFVPETLIPALEELEYYYNSAKADPEFQNELEDLLKHYSGRKTPLYLAPRVSEELGFDIWLKREDLNHTGAHKINNVLGQVLLARRMGKQRIICETGAGQHGVATATASALMGMECIVYMGSLDMQRQSLNVTRMEMLGARVETVESGSRSLKDAVNQTIRDWVTNVEHTYYIIGSALGPHPYPMIVRDFQSVIGSETRQQILEKEGRLPDVLVACVGGGSNAIGMFFPFLDDPVDMIGVEAGGLGLDSGKHSACLNAGSIGTLHGARMYLLQDDNGQILEAHSVAAGLDYPGVGPEHCLLKTHGRVKYVSVTDKQAVEAFLLLSETEGIIPALETAHAIAYLGELVPALSKENIITICLSGRGDKDVAHVAEYLEKNK